MHVIKTLFSLSVVGLFFTDGTFWELKHNVVSSR